MKINTQQPFPIYPLLKNTLFQGPNRHTDALRHYAISDRFPYLSPQELESLPRRSELTCDREITEWTDDFFKKFSPDETSLVKVYGPEASNGAADCLHWNGHPHTNTYPIAQGTVIFTRPSEPFQRVYYTVRREFQQIVFEWMDQGVRFIKWFKVQGYPLGTQHGTAAAAAMFINRSLGNSLKRYLSAQDPRLVATLN